MRKFTVFTIILTIIVVVVVAEIVVNEYLPNLASDGEGKFEFSLPESLDLSKSITTNVLGTDDQSETGGLNNRLGSESAESSGSPMKVSKLSSDLKDENNFYLDVAKLSDETAQLTEPVEIIPNNENDPGTEITKSVELFTNPGNDLEDATKENVTSDVDDFEDSSGENLSLASAVTVYIREDHVRNAGFSDAFLEKETSDGKLFKTILIDDLKDLETDKYVIRNADSLLSKVYIFRADVGSDIKEVYKLLKLRAAEGLNIEINETNEFGLASFYMNDKNRPQTAFLTVRIAGFVYGFAYPKEFHAQIKNLVTLLEWEYN